MVRLPDFRPILFLPQLSLPRCEYIFYRGLYRTAYARVSRGIVTDTEMQIGQFVVPPYKETVKDDSRTARYLRSFKEWLPEDHVSVCCLLYQWVEISFAP